MGGEVDRYGDRIPARQVYLLAPLSFTTICSSNKSHPSSLSSSTPEPHGRRLKVFSQKVRLREGAGGQDPYGRWMGRWQTTHVVQTTLARERTSARSNYGHRSIPDLQSSDSLCGTNGEMARVYRRFAEAVGAPAHGVHTLVVPICQWNISSHFGVLFRLLRLPAGIAKFALATHSIRQIRVFNRATRTSVS